MSRSALVLLLTVAGAAASADAFELRCRWVRRVGTQDVPIPPVDPLIFTPGQVFVLRLQFGLFADGAGDPPPAGGFVGWNVGTIDGTPETVGSAAARLQPFVFAPAPGFQGTLNPLHLNNIDNTLGTQSLVWNGIDGTDDPGPPPAAVVRGNNTFVSVFTLTVTGGTNSFEISAAGNAIAAISWNVIQSNPPVPGDDGIFNNSLDEVPGSVVYAPQTLPPIAFSNCVLHFVPVPAPPAVSVFGLVALTACSRRRARR